MKTIIRKIITRLKKLLKQDNRAEVDKLYQSHDYLEAYTKHTDKRIENDPKSAIGGKWDEIGLLQFDFLIQSGLKANDKFLDIGCGTLRGGRHFIKFLNRECYFGIDISKKAIESAKKLLSDEGLTDKRPNLSLNEKKDLRFEQFQGQCFDIILAQSVFTHLKEEHIEECFKYIGDIMDSNSRFFFTYFEDDKQVVKNHKDFWFPASFFEKLADKYEFELTNRSGVYNHPRKQIMMELSKK